MQKRVLIVGGGPSGLAAGWGLERAGWECTLVEKAGRLGGAVQSERVGGFLVEGGPNALQVKGAAVWGLLRELGLEGQVLRAAPAARRRYLVKGGRLVALPRGPLEALRTPLFSWPGKLRVLREPFIGKGPALESVASFVRRRLGREFLDYGIGALVAGIYAGDPEELSVQAAFPKVWALEQRHGSLIRGAITKMLQRGPRPPKREVVSFAEGLETVVRALVQALRARIYLESQMETLAPQEHAWRATWRTAEGERVEGSFDAVVVTVPVHAWGALGASPEWVEALAALPAVPYPAVTTVMLGYRRADVGHPLDGFGYLAPPVEGRPVLGTVFSSTIFPQRAPEGHVNLLSFLGGRLRPELAELPEADLVNLVQAEHAALLGVRGEPVAVKLRRWPRAIPQYDRQHLALVAGVEALERRWPGLVLQGNFRGGPGLNDSLENGLAVAGRLQSLRG